MQPLEGTALEMRHRLETSPVTQMRTNVLKKKIGK